MPRARPHMRVMIPLSVLDLAPIAEGSDAGIALNNARDLARHAERLGYHRFWMAEHHSMPGIASAATAVALAYVAGGTETIRVGAGGIMLPNHSRCRSPSSSGRSPRCSPGGSTSGSAARRAPTRPRPTRCAATSRRRRPIPARRGRLQSYFRPAEPGQRVIAVPGEGLDVPLWILGSSTFGAELAAELGLPYAFASHFAPQQMMDAIALYRARFKPSAQLAAPYVMLGFNVFAADSDEEGELLATSLMQAFVALRSGNPGKLKPPLAGYADTLPLEFRAMLRVGAVELGDWQPGHGPRRDRGVCRPHRRRRIDGHDADFRPSTRSARTNFWPRRSPSWTRSTLCRIGR